MDLVLGLSMTSSSVRWVLVEGTAGDGATLDRGCRPLDGLDVGALLDELLARAAPNRVHAVGLTWSAAAETAASGVWQGLTDRGIENLIAVSDIEAVETLAVGIAEMAESERVVVGVAEPDGLLRASVSPEGVVADHVGPDELADGVDAADVVFVLGSGDVPAVMADVEQRAEVAVISADQADLALARGAALASASAVALLDAPESSSRTTLSMSTVLASVVGAAAVTLVVSVSAAVGLSLTPQSPAHETSSVQEPAREAAPPPARVLPPEPAAPAAPVVEAPPAPVIEAPAAPVVEAPAPQAPPVYDQPAPEQAAPLPETVAPPPDVFAPAPGAPVLVPPGGPLPGAVSPPVVVEAQQPRLRDRIIERIPILNRFHEPQNDYTP
jgi:hypothetical protein